MGFLLDACGLRRVQLLLLLNILIIKASAKCSRPMAPIEMMLTNATVLRSDFPDGIAVTLDCFDGYDRISGTGFTTCTNGEWSKPDLVCRKKDCGPPPPQPNMMFDLRGGTMLSDIIKVTCEKGYQIRGTSYKQCFAFGWLGRSECVVKNCGNPVLQPNMTVSIPTGTLYGAEIEVFCDKGYKLIGSRKRKCEAKGWSGSAKCEIIRCKAPGELAGGRSSWDSKEDPTVGQTVHYLCNEGYVLNGTDAIVCQENGEYDHLPPTCLVKNCGNPVLQPNMTVSIPNGTLYGAEIEVFCDKGYKLIGSRKRKCEAKGWSGSAKCEIIRCKAPGELAGGRSSWDSKEDPTVGQTVHYLCNEGYVLNGTDAIVCQENGEYDHLPPTCLDSTAAPTALKYQPTSKQSEAHGDGSIPDLKDECPVCRPEYSGDGSIPALRGECPTFGPGFSGIITFTIIVAFFTLGGCIAIALIVAFVSKRTGSYNIEEGLKMESVAIKTVKVTPEISQSEL